MKFDIFLLGGIMVLIGIAIKNFYKASSISYELLPWLFIIIGILIGIFSFKK